MTEDGEFVNAFPALPIGQYAEMFMELLPPGLSRENWCLKAQRRCTLLNGVVGAVIYISPTEQVAVYYGNSRTGAGVDLYRLIRRLRRFLPHIRVSRRICQAPQRNYGWIVRLFYLMMKKSLREFFQIYSRLSLHEKTKLNEYKIKRTILNKMNDFLDRTNSKSHLCIYV